MLNIFYKRPFHLLSQNGLSAVLLCIFVLCLWNFFPLQHHTTHPLKLALLIKNQPDASVDHFTASFFNAEGNLSLKIMAPHMIHFADHNRTEFVSPILIIYQQSTQPWKITAGHGTAFEGMKQLNFKSDVHIEHRSDEKTPYTSISTSTLQFYPEEHLATTNAVIHFSQPNLRIEGQGMRANLKTGDVHLLKKTVGEYVPKKTN